MKTISLCLTNYNRHELLIKSFEKVLADDRISEIIISDDHSDDNIYFDLKRKLIDESAFSRTSKVKLHRNDINIGMSLNKAKSISLATNEWCILLDSDNVIDKDYIDCLYDLFKWEPDIIYQPDFAAPSFDFRKFAGICVDKNTNKKYIDDSMYFCFLNACNYFVHRQTYLETYEHNSLIKEVDTMWHNYNHLKAGGKIYFVPEMTYVHTVHAGSGWMRHADENMAKAEEIKKLMLGL